MNMEVWSRSPQVFLSCFSALCLVLLNAAFVQADHSGKCNYTTQPWRTTAVPVDHLLPSPRTNFTFEVKTCNFSVILGVKDKNMSYEYRLDLFGVKKLVSEKCDRCNPFQSVNIFKDGACNESQHFSISLTEEAVKVRDHFENGTVYWNGSLEPQVEIDYVVLASWQSGVNETEWIIDADCSKISTEAETPSTVTQGHLAGAVIAALIAGILLGGAGAYFGPDLWEISKERLPVLWKRKENTTDETECSDLFDGKRSPTPEKSNTKDEEMPEEKGYISMAVGKRRAPSNAYTPCTVSTATPPSRPTVQRQGVSRTDGAKPTDRTRSAPDGKATPDVKRVTVSQPKSKGKLSTKASAKPTKIVARVHKEEEEPGEIYANEDAQVYEGMKHDLPIYENRNTGTYESLNVGK